MACIIASFFWRVVSALPTTLKYTQLSPNLNNININIKHCISKYYIIINRL